MQQQQQPNKCSQYLLCCLLSMRPSAVPWFRTTPRTSLFVFRDDRDFLTFADKNLGLGVIHKLFSWGMQWEALTDRAGLSSLCSCRNWRGSSWDPSLCIPMSRTPSGGAPSQTVPQLLTWKNTSTSSYRQQTHAPIPMARPPSSPITGAGRQCRGDKFHKDQLRTEWPVSK